MGLSVDAASFTNATEYGAVYREPDLKALFLEALERPEGHERAAFLDAARRAQPGEAFTAAGQTLAIADMQLSGE